jgi:hypothetical protein
MIQRATKVETANFLDEKAVYSAERPERLRQNREELGATTKTSNETRRSGGESSSTEIQ